jgi:hypothetical protein
MGKSGLMGYLICERCAGYYQLKEGESPEDFGRCHCGGHLNYVDEIEDAKFIDKINFRRIAAVFIGAAIMIISFYIYSSDPYSTSFVYNNNTVFLIWGAAGLIAALIAGGNIKSGVSNGFYAASISGLIVILMFYYIKNNYFTNPSLAENIGFFMALCMVYLLIPAVFSCIGGLIGGLLRKVVKKFIV